ncbi:hypothetical protein EON63_16840 [archaeon]|nr:MAG: hypothetical protein EON63_16840 [archaeon]
MSRLDLVSQASLTSGKQDNGNNGNLEVMDKMGQLQKQLNKIAKSLLAVETGQTLDTPNIPETASLDSPAMGPSSRKPSIMLQSTTMQNSDVMKIFQAISGIGENVHQLVTRLDKLERKFVRSHKHLRDKIDGQLSSNHLETDADDGGLSDYPNTPLNQEKRTSSQRKSRAKSSSKLAAQEGAFSSHLDAPAASDRPPAQPALSSEETRAELGARGDHQIASRPGEHAVVMEDTGSVASRAEEVEACIPMDDPDQDGDHALHAADTHAQPRPSPSARPRPMSAAPVSYNSLTAQGEGTDGHEE